MEHKEHLRTAAFESDILEFHLIQDLDMGLIIFYVAKDEQGNFSIKKKIFFNEISIQPLKNMKLLQGCHA